MRFAGLAAVMVAILLVPITVWADGGGVDDERVAELERQVKELRRTVDSLMDEIRALTSGQQEQGQEVERLKTVQEDQTAELEELKGEEYPQVEIGGQYRVMANSSNFPFHTTSITDDQQSQSFSNQRFRTWLTVHANEDISGYLQMEVGHNVWGDDYEFTKTYGDDEVGVELRRGFLSYRREDIGTFRVGIQDWSDSFWDTLASGDWDFNVGGIHFSRTIASLGDAEVGLGAFKMWEGAEGDVTKDRDESNLFVADLDVPVRGESSVGVSLYYLYDNDEYSYPFGAGLERTYPAGPYDSSWDSWLGLRGKTVCRSTPLEAFILYNRGKMDDPDWDHDGFALGARGSRDLGWGTLSVQGLYSTGDDDSDDGDSDEFRTVAQSVRDNFGSQGYWSYLTLTSPSGPSDVNDLGVGLQNRGLGLLTLQAKLEFPLTDNLSGYTAVGLFRSDEKRPVSDEEDMGTEVMAQATYDFGHGLKLDLGGAYFFTGDFYRAAPAGDSPDDLYELFARMQLEF